MKKIKLTLRISPGLSHRLKEQSAREECSINTLVIRAILEYLNFSEQ